jgi:hypothetical protein
MKMSSGFSSNFNNLITNIFARTNQQYYAQFSFADLWTFGTSIKHETGSGFTNSGTAITSIIGSLKYDGDDSNLYDCLEYALIGQQPAAISGITGGVMLALGRAMGETMAVTMIIGNSNNFSLSLLAPGNTIASMLANQFGEADGNQVSSLMYAALILMLLTLIVNVLAQWVVRRLSLRYT